MEKIIPQKKEITALSVKEVLLSLADDDVVGWERIGTSNDCWAFPSEVLHVRKCR